MHLTMPAATHTSLILQCCIGSKNLGDLIEEVWALLLSGCGALWRCDGHHSRVLGVCYNADIVRKFPARQSLMCQPQLKYLDPVTPSAALT